MQKIALVLLACLVSACGYALSGRGSSLPAHIRVIAVPQFENQTDEPDLDLRLTEAVRQELIGRGRYTVRPDAAGAHAVLTAKIKNRQATPRVLDRQTMQVSRYEVAVVAEVSFRDETKNESLYSNPNLRAAEEYDLPGSARPEDLTSLFRQDRNAIERIARTFARTLVSSILENF